MTKLRFNKRLLTPAKVQKGAKAQCGRDVGRVMTVLAEEEDAGHPGMITGRLSNNLMVHFPGTAQELGRLIPVLLTESRGFYYMGARTD